MSKVAIVISRTAVGYEDTPESASKRWDAGQAVARLRRWAGVDASDAPASAWAKYRRGFAWVDQENRQTLGGYKLPHHDVEGGALVLNRQGMIAAGGALQGARGGVDIPAPDVPRVRSHLGKHYRALGMTPPWREEAAAESKPAGYQRTMVAAVARMMTCGQCTYHEDDDHCSHPDCDPRLMAAGALPEDGDPPPGCPMMPMAGDAAASEHEQRARDHHPGPHGEGSPGEKSTLEKNHALNNRDAARGAVQGAKAAERQGNRTGADRGVDSAQTFASRAEAAATNAEEIAKANPADKAIVANARYARRAAGQARQAADGARKAVSEIRSFRNFKQERLTERAIGVVERSGRSVEGSMAVARADAEKQLVYLIASRCDCEDAYGCTMDAAEVERSAHRFMESRMIGLNHMCSHEGCLHTFGDHASGAKLGACRADGCTCTKYEAMEAPAVRLVENFVVGVDTDEWHGVQLSEPFKRGDHVIALKVNHGLLWAFRDGITGCSWEGTVEVMPPEEMAGEMPPHEPAEAP